MSQSIDVKISSEDDRSKRIGIIDSSICNSQEFDYNFDEYNKIDLGYQGLSQINESGWSGKNEDDQNEDFKVPEANKVVIWAKKIRIALQYPVTDVPVFEHEIQDGFTRKQLAELIAQDYRTMYEEEKRTTEDHGEDGKYGIYGVWGHEEEDLILHTAYYNPKTGLVLCRCDS